MIRVAKKQESLVELEIPAKPRYVGVARLIISSLARMQDFKEEAIDDLKIAVSELCTNAIIHTDRQGGQPIIVRFSTTEKSISVEVEDRGPGFDAACIGRVREDGLVEKGFGIPLIKTLVDDFVCDSTSSGTCIRIVKYRKDDE
ncbi:MAG: ATP-binding protein [Candidatus Geothermincolia bacterium]